METRIGYKIMARRKDNRLRSYNGLNGGKLWVIGKWERFAGDILMCNSGFHCWPQNVPDRFYETPSGLYEDSVIAMVEYDASEGNFKENQFPRKVVSKAMRIIRVVPIAYPCYDGQAAIKDAIESFYR